MNKTLETKLLLKQKALSLAEVMKFSRKKLTGRILGTSFRRIPNVSRVLINVNEWNHTLGEIGLSKRNPPQILSDRLDPSDCMNSYQKRQIARLIKISKVNPSKFWKLAWFLMSKSTAIRVSAFNHVLPQWWYTIPMYKIKTLNKKVQKLIDEKSRSFDFRRVYIPKPNGKSRPLGVPEVEWRIYLHIFNNFLVLFVRNSLSRSQHGYIPGKGTMTAWQELIRNGLDRKNIYETDLKGFFDGVSLAAIKDKLTTIGMPKETMDVLLDVNLNLPKLPCGGKFKPTDPTLLYRELIVEKYIENFYKIPLKRDLSRGQSLPKMTWRFIYDWYLLGAIKKLLTFIDKRKFIYKHINLIKTGMLSPKMGMWIHRRFSQQEMLEFNISSWLTDFSFRLRKTHVTYNSYRNPDISKYTPGVAQGSPTSPILSILVLTKYLNQQSNVNYADDQVFFGDNTFEIKEDRISGALHNPDKCRWVKKDGVWLEKLKFLGLVYDPWTKELESSTRNGSKIKIDSDLTNLWSELRNLEKDRILKDISQRAIFGWIQACLYKGSFREATLEIPGLGKPHSLSWLGYYSRIKSQTSHASQSIADLIKYGTIGLSVTNPRAFCKPGSCFHLRPSDFKKPRKQKQIPTKTAGKQKTCQEIK